MLDDSEILNLCENYIKRSDNYTGSMLSQNRDQATDYYLGRLEGRGAPSGLSEQLDGSVADMVDAVSAEMGGSLFASDALAEFEPQGEDDRLPARLESAVVNKVISEQNAGFELLSAAVQSAALYKIGVIHVGAEEIDKPRTRYVGPVAGEEKTVLEADSGGTVDDDGYLSWTETQKRVALRVVAPENFFIDKEYPGWTLEGSNFVAERQYIPRGDLLEMGFTWNEIAELGERSVLNDQQDLTRRYANQGDDVRSQGIDETELIEVYWCYVRLPDTGHNLRLFRVLIAEGTVLDKMPCDAQPYCVGRLIPVIGRFHGVSLHDRLKPIEDGRQTVLRQLEDNLAYSNNAELVLGATANADDAKDRIPGGYIRADDPADVVPLPAADMTSQGIAYLDTLAQLRSERGGSAMDMQRADSQIMRGSNQVGSMGVGMLLSAAELRTAWYTRNIAESLIRQVFCAVHECLRRYEVDPVGVWIAGQYVQVDTRQFRERENVNVRGGMSSGERVRRLQALDTSIQYAISMAQVAGPGVLTDLSTVHQQLIDRDKAAGIDNPNRYWIDPQSQESLQAQQSNAQSQQQQQDLATQIELADKKNAADKLQLDKYKHDREIEWKYYDTNVDADKEEARIVADSITKLETQRNATNDTGTGEGNGRRAANGGDN